VKTRKVAAQVLLAALTIGGASATLTGVSGATAQTTPVDIGTVGRADVKAPAGLVEQLAATHGYKCNLGNNGAGPGNPALSTCDRGSGPGQEPDGGSGGGQDAPVADDGGSGSGPGSPGGTPPSDPGDIWFS
jgi:hypothetical protein